MFSKRYMMCCGVTGAVALAGVSVAGCGGSSHSASAPSGVPAASTSGGSAGSQLVIGYSDPSSSSPLLASVGLGEQQAIKQLHLSWKVRDFNANLSPGQQVSDVNTMISLKVGGITTWTLSQGAAEGAYARAKAARIPVIGINSSSPSFAAEIGSDAQTNCVVSNDQAAYIAARIPHANVLAIGGPPVPSITLITNCFLSAAKRDGLHVVERQNDQNAQQSNGQQIVGSALLRYPDLQAVWSYSEVDALGAGVALNNGHKRIWTKNDKGVIVLARGGSVEGAAAVKSGSLTADWDNNQPLAGAAAVQVLKYILVDHVPIASLPKVFTVPSFRWDGFNIDSYESPVTRTVKLPLPIKFAGRGSPSNG